MVGTDIAVLKQGGVQVVVMKLYADVGQSTSHDLDGRPSLLELHHGWFVVLVFVLVESMVTTVVLVRSGWTALEALQGNITDFVTVCSISSEP